MKLGAGLLGCMLLKIDEAQSRQRYASLTAQLRPPGLQRIKINFLRVQIGVLRSQRMLYANLPFVLLIIRYLAIPLSTKLLGSVVASRLSTGRDNHCE